MQTNATLHMHIPEWQLAKFPPIESSSPFNPPRIDGNILRAQNDLNGLRWVLDFKWLRPMDLGLLLWPSSTDGTRRAYKVIREWLSKKWILERHHEDLGCKVIVLTESGARYLKSEGIPYAQPDTDWGRINNGIWRPGKEWRHDFICTRLALCLLHRGFSIKTERQVRAEYSKARSEKWPDLLALDPSEDVQFWIEVESSRKTGKNMDDLAKTLIRLHERDDGIFLKQKAFPAIAFIEGTRDTQTGHRINHLGRVKSAIRRFSENPISLNCFRLDQTRHLSDIKEIVIDPTWMIHNLRSMARRPWQEEPGFPPGAKCVENFPHGRNQHSPRYIMGYWLSHRSDGIPFWSWKKLYRASAYSSEYENIESGTVPCASLIRRHIAQYLWVNEPGDC